LDESDAKNIVEAARELGEAYEETEGLLSDFTESLKAAENLYGSGKKGTGADLVSLGMRAGLSRYWSKMVLNPYSPLQSINGPY